MLEMSTNLFLLITSVVARSPRIFHGLSAKASEIPYQVSIYSVKGYHTCGGSILNENYVITAAHCIKNIQKDKVLILTGHNITNPESVYYVASTRLHEQYNLPTRHANDIGLIKVHPPFKFNEFVSSVALPEPHSSVTVGEKALISGWGSTRTPDLFFPFVLKKLRTTIVDQEYCLNAYTDTDKSVLPTMFCTHEIGDVRKGACIADSGGPVTINGNVLIGVISWSKKDPDCASLKYPDVNIRVSDYIDWINEHAT